MTFAQCLFLASLHRRRRVVLSSVAGIVPLSYRPFLEFFGILHNFRIQKYAVRNLWPFTRLPHAMAAHRFIEALLDGGSITVFGDGGQVRDFSYVGDVADATVRSLSTDLPPAAVLDIASGNPVDVGLSSSFLEEHAEGCAPACSTSYASTEQQRTALLWRWRPR